MCFGFVLVIVGTITELILIFLRVDAPPLSVFTFIICNCFICFAIWKYELFSVNPATAAENIIATMSDSLLLVAPDGKIISANDSAHVALGYSKDEIAALPVESVLESDEGQPSWRDICAGLDEIPEIEDPEGKGNENKSLEAIFRTKDKKEIPISLAGSALLDDAKRPLGFVLIGRDIREKKQAEEELRQHRDHLEELVEKRTRELKLETFEKMKVEATCKDLQEQLYQSQKMEAIGRLAGGVAHDFNNLLFVIAGYAESILFSMAEDDPSRVDAQEVSNAAHRAAGLTQQLLAFSRKQVITPKPTDLRETFKGIKNMLGRIIGEDIELVFVPSENLGQVMVDPVQMDQVLANLFVNARDAMPGGGKLTVSAKNVYFDKTITSKKADLKPGNYVQLSVSDTGCGMDEATCDQIFEPFFTTKEQGKGTGLGLSTVYGIIKQNHGVIDVSSKRGVGTKFDIYFPEVESEEAPEAELTEIVVPSGTETILLVEDESAVRQLASQQLKKQGYDVLEAKDAKEAIDLFKRYEEKIDLLFTDIVMPGMSGMKLSEHLEGERPSLRVLFMSGHNEEIIDQHGCLATDKPLLQKPFTYTDLSWKIREILDA
ncbi:MAG: response regulator [Myxococcota bacterium]|nr:response regulator [Myxococcota bacterium]